MKPGSIVVCLEIPEIYHHLCIKPHIKWLPIPDKKTEYMLRVVEQASNSSDIIVAFEEGIIGYDPSTGGEWGFPIECVREILSADAVDISIEELITV